MLYNNLLLRLAGVNGTYRRMTMISGCSRPVSHSEIRLIIMTQMINHPWDRLKEVLMRRRCNYVGFPAHYDFVDKMEHKRTRESLCFKGRQH